MMDEPRLREWTRFVPEADGKTYMSHLSEASATPGPVSGRSAGRKIAQLIAQRAEAVASDPQTFDLEADRPIQRWHVTLSQPARLSLAKTHNDDPLPGFYFVAQRNRVAQESNRRREIEQAAPGRVVDSRPGRQHESRLEKLLPAPDARELRPKLSS